MVNINKIFPWLSIRHKLIIAFIGLSVLPAALLGVHGIFSNVTMMRTIAFENLSHDVQTIREKTANFLARVENDLHLVKNSVSLQRLLYQKAHSGKLQKNDLWVTNNELLTFAQTRGIYYQVRLIDGEGDELLRIECTDHKNIPRAYRIVSSSDLQQRRESYYVLLTANLQQGEITFSPAELVDPNGERVPVISFATRMNGPGRNQAILIANVFASDLFQVVESKRHLDMQGKVVLVSSDGHYLYHSEKKRDWNKLLASREEDNLNVEYQREIVALLLSGKEGVVSEGITEIIAFAPLFASSGFKVERGTYSHAAVPFYVFESLPEEVVLGPVRAFAMKFAAFLVLLLAAAIGLGMVATRQFTKPIAELQRGAAIISQGNYTHRLHVKTHDEIEQLGEQFNTMAGSLEAHDREIRQHRTTLEEMVGKRTRELSEEKSKLQAIVDNVPSAFVLLDKEFRVQSASAAFATVTGWDGGEVRGKDCREMFCGNGFCGACVSEQAMMSGAIETRVDLQGTVNGSERYIEHVAIPFKEGNEVSSILEIITDITKRKRFEQYLLQTERLMAAGEMSALIAHEFRNSLTSIKMILQLQRESERLSRSERKSLGVALNSIYHMEEIVAELLTFARPSPPKFRFESLEAIVGECLAFIELQTKKYHIRVTKEIDPSLPLVRLDAQQVKEVLINVLLNALQAIQSKPSLSGREQVSVLIKRGTLKKTMHDFRSLSSGDSPVDGVNNKEQELILHRGQACVVIEVNDTGPGIPRTIQRRVFDPFFTTKPNGTGLGLPMVKQTVNAHGGIVTVRSSKNKGATFTIYFPMSAEGQNDD